MSAAPAQNPAPCDTFLASPTSLTTLSDQHFSNNNDQCPICYSDIDINTISTPCNHIFHRECLDTWLRTLDRSQDGTCPSCRGMLYEGEGDDSDAIVAFEALESMRLRWLAITTHFHQQQSGEEQDTDNDTDLSYRPSPTPARDVELERPNQDVERADIETLLREANEVGPFAQHFAVGDSDSEMSEDSEGEWYDREEQRLIEEPVAVRRGRRARQVLRAQLRRNRYREEQEEQERRANAEEVEVEVVESDFQDGTANRPYVIPDKEGEERPVRRAQLSVEEIEEMNQSFGDDEDEIIDLTEVSEETEEVIQSFGYEEDETTDLAGSMEYEGDAEEDGMGDWMNGDGTSAEEENTMDWESGDDGEEFDDEEHIIGLTNDDYTGDADDEQYNDESSDIHSDVYGIAPDYEEEYAEYADMASNEAFTGEPFNMEQSTFEPFSEGEDYDSEGWSETYDEHNDHDVEAAESSTQGEESDYPSEVEDVEPPAVRMIVAPSRGLKRSRDEEEDVEYGIGAHVEGRAVKRVRFAEY
ncbi:hypothetical protein CC80DRAFT_594777 [Byssothecium circinans]|uniref:RING-type domain-containing protein n=1 Tax=Byssothecium circinans TaxID=147558 RepID=A0A6A5TRX5_9PLEO|nr:hypothetical protein CC80DRAFT_594777 [Byssothecium circinans]